MAAGPSRPGDDLEARLRSTTRRGFAISGATILAGFGTWRWLVTRSLDDGLIWPLRRVHNLNERIGRAAFSPSRRARDFPRSAAREPRVNGTIGMEPALDAGAWRLRVEGEAGAAPRVLDLDAIRALPRHEQTTELKCIEGWSTVVHWAGARLADLAASTGLASRGGRPYDPASPPADLLDYVGMSTPDAGYYVGLDMPGALHPQTLLCYEMDGQPLSPAHGAPLRLVIPVKYGIKNIKRIGTIRFADSRPADYWAENGYDWYSGH